MRQRTGLVSQDGGHLPGRLPVPFYSNSFYCPTLQQAAEVFFTEDDECLVACLYAVTPALTTAPLPGSAAPPQPLPPLQQQQQPGGSIPMIAGTGGVVVTADMRVSVYDQELEQWGLLYRQTLPARTGFGADGSVRYTECVAFHYSQIPDPVTDLPVRQVGEGGYGGPT